MILISLRDCCQAFRIVTSLPVVLLRSASKQLQEGYKAAKHRLSYSGAKSSSFSDRDESRNTSFDSTSTDVKMNSRHSSQHDFPIVQESSQEMDETPDFGVMPEAAPCTPSLMGDGDKPSPKRQFPGFFATPKHTKSKLSITSPVSRFFHRNSASAGSRAKDTDSELKSPAQMPDDGGSAELSPSHLMSPRLSETSSTLSQQITSIMQSSFSSLKKGFDSFNGNVDDDDSNDGSPPATDETPTKSLDTAVK